MSNANVTPGDQLDLDIAGPGVIIGFILTNFLTLAASSFTIWLRRKSNTDTMLFELSASKWQPILTDFVLQLSDQQLLTSLVMMVVGLIKYYQGSVKHGANNLWTAGDIVVESENPGSRSKLTKIVLECDACCHIDRAAAVLSPPFQTGDIQGGTDVVHLWDVVGSGGEYIGS